MMALCIKIFMCILLFRLSRCLVELPGVCQTDARYRTFDGSCNNLAYPNQGKAGTAQRRFHDANGDPMVDYFDGIELPRGGIPSTLPSPRSITNKLSNASLGPSDQSDSLRSGQNMAFGQLMAHDFIKTTIPTGVDCCDTSTPHYNNSDICFNFEIPENDTIFTTGCKSFMRATKAIADAILPAYRENINSISSYIDASFLYGSSDSEVQSLRESGSYLMKTGSLNIIPMMTGGGCVQFHGECPLAGDTRVGETPNLGLSHIVWIREHNRIAEQLSILNPKNTTTYPYTNNGTFFQETYEDMIFQETRRIIIAMVQHITYNHYLPSILDSTTLSTYNLLSSATGYSDMYDATKDVSTRNGFGTGPFRYGHSQIMSQQSRLESDYVTVHINLLEENLKNPQLYLINNGSYIESLARWLTYTSADKIDSFLTDGARDQLFFRSETPAHDLFSLNIQRGRDQGTPGFNRWRNICGLSNMTFDDFGSVNETLRYLYSSPDDIDFFIGGLLEQGTNGGLGPTFACIMGKQFELFKKGDRYWYERADSNFGFSEAQLNSIKQNTNYGKMFCRHFGLSKIQQDIFQPGINESLLYNCNDLSEIDLSHWQLSSSSSTSIHFFSSSLTLVAFYIIYKVL